jgi:hypothetical protein
MKFSALSEESTVHAELIDEVKAILKSEPERKKKKVDNGAVGP